MKTISARIFALILSALMILALIIPAASLADEGVMIYLGSEKVTPDGTKYTYSWDTLPADNSPILNIRAQDTSQLEVVGDSYVFLIPVKLEKPASVAQDAVPYWFTGRREIELEEGTSKDCDIMVSKAYIDAGGDIDGTIEIRWKNGNSVLATEIVQYSIVGGNGGNFNSVARPEGSRVSVEVDNVFTPDSAPSITWELDAKGDLTFTVQELTKEQIIEAYSPGMTDFFADVTVAAPEGYDEVMFISGNMSYDAFDKNCETGTFRPADKCRSGISLWQIDETAAGITVSPRTYTFHYYMCWKDKDNLNNKKPERLKITVKLGDNAKVISVPEEELKQIDDVPASRLSHGGPEEMKAIATEAGATFSATDGNALFTMTKTPDKVVALANTKNWEFVPLDLWIEAPEEGYDKFALTLPGRPGQPQDTIISNNRRYAEFPSSIYHSDYGIMTEDVNVTITWMDSTGAKADRIEKFNYKSTFDGITWMDIYWAPAPKELLTTSDAIEDLKAMGFVVEIEDGKVVADLDDSVLPTVEQVIDLMHTQLCFDHSKISGLENAATFRWGNISGGMSNEYNQSVANEQKTLVGNNDATDVSSPWLQEICRLEKKPVGNEGIDYYCVEIYQNEVGLIQFYDNTGELISVSDDNGNAKEGYYYTFEMKPYHYFLNTIVVEEVTAAVTMPTLVLPDSAGKDWKLRTELFTQKNNSGNNPKYYLRLTPVADKEDLKALIEKGADVYIPYSMIKEGLTYEEALNNRTFHVRHYENEEHKKFDNLKGEPTPYGMKFTVTHFSPFVIETVTATDPAPAPGDITNNDNDNDNDNDNGNVQLTPLLPPQTGDDMSSFGAAALVLGAAAFILARRKAR